MYNGSRAEGGVVDEKLRVHGTRNWRVVDASVFPLQVRGEFGKFVLRGCGEGSGFCIGGVELRTFGKSELTSGRVLLRSLPSLLLY